MHRKVCVFDLERKLERARSRLGNEDREIGEACADLGLLYQKQDRHAEAEEKYLEALRIFGVVEGEASIEVATVMGNLSRVYQEQERLDDSLPVQKRVVRMIRRLYASEHYKVAVAIHDLACILAMM